MNADPRDTGMAPKIGDYGLISDCRSAALVSRDGSIDWLCAPRFDSPAFFARLLDPHAGRWQLSARDVLETTREYIGSTMVLQTTIRANEGAIRITTRWRWVHANAGTISLRTRRVSSCAWYDVLRGASSSRCTLHHVRSTVS